MKKKKYIKAAGGMIAGGIGLGVGAHAMSGTGLTGAGGTAIGQAQAVVGKVAGAMPTMGTIVAGGMVMGAVKKMGDAAKMKGKKY